MTDLISIIGTVASIGSIPLAIYLFLKNSEERKDKVRRDVVRTIAFQIGNGRVPTSFEIQAIINSKSRESKINSSLIDFNDVIEDLVAEIISTPILSSEMKDKYISTFNLLYTRGQVFEIIDRLTVKNITDEQNENVERDIKQLLEKKESIDKEVKKIKDKTTRYSEVFGYVASTLSLVGVVLTMSMAKLPFDTLTNVKVLFTDNKDVVNITLGLVVSIIAAVGMELFIKIFNRKDKKGK
jgi:hypothetical protein